MAVYLTKTIFVPIKKLYNTALFHLFKLDLRRMNSLDQHILLQKMSLEANKARLFYRISLFSHKIMNNSSFLSYFKNNLILCNDQTKSIRIRNYNQTKEHDIFLLP